MRKKAVVTSNGIKELLKKYEWHEAICEYIWNGFDAGASHVEITYKVGQAPLTVIQNLSITDNGGGISRKNLSNKFRPIYESEKNGASEQPKNHSLPHGKNGKGRLTFFVFCNRAKWLTTCFEDNQYVSQEIIIQSNQLDSYDPHIVTTKNEKTGTTVVFENIDPALDEYEIQTRLLQHLKREFAWFLELFKIKQFMISINGKSLDYEDLVYERTSQMINKGIKEKEFALTIVLWKEKLNQEYSKFYYIKSDGMEGWKENTSLNNKSDNFYHSVFLQSRFFDDFYWTESERSSEQGMLFKNRSDNDFKKVFERVSKILHEKRNPFVEKFIELLIAEYEKEDVFPDHGKSPVAQYQNTAIRETVKEIYKIEPKVFTNLNQPQKKAFIGLLDALLDLGADDRLLDVISKIVEMSREERNKLATVLDYASVSAISKTITMIKDRFTVVQQLKEIISDDCWRATEAEIQDIIEKHFWLFGEQYNLVTAEEQKFEEALRRYLYLLRGDGITRNPKIKSLNKDGEMDIFACRKNVGHDTIQNIVVELKHPNIKLGRLELNQVDTYSSVILEQPEFMALNTTWNFILVGRSLDTSGAIEREYTNARPHGERYLVKSFGSARIYVMRWSDVFAEFECRHKFLLEKLELDKAKIMEEIKKNKTAKEVATDAVQNGAAETASWDNEREPIGVK